VVVGCALGYLIGNCLTISIDCNYPNICTAHIDGMKMGLVLNFDFSIIHNPLDSFSVNISFLFVLP
jgi:hypothetical protein